MSRIKTKINDRLPKNEREGQIGINNQDLEMKIKKYRNCDDIDVEFLIDGYISEHKTYQSFLFGMIENKNFKKFIRMKFTESLLYLYPKVAEAIAIPENNLTLDDCAKIKPYSSTLLFYVKCDDCGKISRKKKYLSNLTRYGLTCEFCSDNISIPNKMLRQIAIQLNLNWEFEYSEDWMGKKRFDAYDIDLRQPIEMDAFFKDNHKGKRKEVDNWKDEQAVEHDMKLTRRINLMDENKYKNNTLEYIKYQIYNTIGDLYNLDNMDWELAWLNCQKNLLLETCRLWKEEHIYSTTEIGKILKLCSVTISSYLNRGYKLGLCDYTREKAIKERGKRSKSINNYCSILYWVIKSNGEKYSDRPLCGSEIYNDSKHKGFLNLDLRSFNKYVRPYNSIDISRIKINGNTKKLIEKLTPYDGWQFIPLTKEEKEEYLESIK